MPIARLQLARGVTHRCEAGHPWIYSSEIGNVVGSPRPGDEIDVYLPNGRFVGRGFYNPHSQIVARLYTRHDEALDAAFFRRRVREALAHRERFLDDARHGRMIHGEGDFLPGLVADRFGDTLVIQVLTLPMDRRRELLLDALEEVFSPAGIFERSDAGARRKDGVEPRVGVARGTVPDRGEAVLNGLRFEVDFAGGQKTGFFYDQRENLRVVESLVRRGDRVLDCFSYLGSFALHATRGGAASVEGVDISADACAAAATNAERNGLADRCHFTAGNAFDLLRERADARERYDMVILDPPAFTKTRAAAAQAMRGYKEINLRALHMIAEGGVLVTFSCSHHVSRESLRETVLAAARDARRSLRLLHDRTQSLDHPILAGVPETEYLKMFAYQIF